MPYLHALGIGDCYASPYFQARAESLHGYEITDHNKLNDAIGSREDYDAWVAELHAHGMGQVLDFVPNHMGIREPQNLWWADVLENGPSSAYAPYFDIDWQPLKADLRDKVLIPILGDQYGRVLERGELRVHFESGRFFLRYFEHEFPIAPGTYRHVLEIALAQLAGHKEEDFYAELQSIITALEYLPRRTETDPERIAERAREKEVIKRRLERRCQEAPLVEKAIEKALTIINGTPGDPRSFDALDALLSDQAYRLAFWRVAAEEINYRRFFDINDLAAIRMELPEVFDETHRLLFDLVATGAVTGLRIDHPDGLYLPNEYFEKLQRRVAGALSERGAPVSAVDGLRRGESARPGLAATSPSERAIYLVVEKILSGDEQLRTDWPVHGTTGYDFMNDAIGVLVDASAERAITSAFHKFIGHSLHFGHLVYAKKRLVMRLSLANDVSVLGTMFDRISEKNRWYRDYTLDTLTLAVRETIACFPVYRTYLAPGRPVSDADRVVIERAVAAAKRRNPAVEESVFQFSARHPALPIPGKPGRCSPGRAPAFRAQVPADYRANHGERARRYRLLHLQPAGGVKRSRRRTAALRPDGGRISSPECRAAGAVAGDAPRNFHPRHEAERRRARADGGDLGNTGSLAPFVEPLAHLQSALETTVEENEAPDSNEEYLLYQTLARLLAVAAISRDGVTRCGAEYVARIQQYMAKAMKEAKLNTSWVQPNESVGLGDGRFHRADSRSFAA